MVGQCNCEVSRVGTVLFAIPVAHHSLVSVARLEGCLQFGLALLRHDMQVMFARRKGNTGTNSAQRGMVKEALPMVPPCDGQTNWRNASSCACHGEIRISARSRRSEKKAATASAAAAAGPRYRDSAGPPHATASGPTSVTPAWASASVRSEDTQSVGHLIHCMTVLWYTKTWRGLHTVAVMQHDRFCPRIHCSLPKGLFEVAKSRCALV